MKSLLLTGIWILLFASCNRPQTSNQNIIKTTFYSTGKVKEILSLNSDSINNGLCFYFDEYGYLDSSITYLNGKLNGLKQLYYPDYGIYAYEYQNDSVIRHKVYDTLNILKYETPLDLKTISKPIFRLSSTRDYFDQDKGDTITIITKGLPAYNRGLSISGAVFKRLNDSTNIVTVSRHNDDLKMIKITISIYQHLGDTTEIPVIFNHITIPVK